MKLKMKWLSGLTLGVASFVILGLGCLQAPVTAFADNTIGGVDVSSFTMEYGAGVRRVDDGIRFSATMSAKTYADLEALETDNVSVSYGVIITTSKYANAYGLTEENVFGTNAKYYWDEKGTFTDENSQTQDQVRVINKISPVMGREDGAKEDTPVYLYGMVLDTVPDDASDADKKTYMQGKYVARAYIKYETTDGENTTAQYHFASYYDGDIANNTRSMYQTALNRIKADDKDSANLYTAYVAPVFGEEYKIVTSIDGVVQSEQNVTSAWTAEDVVNALTKTDYKKVSLTASKVSGEIVLSCDFTSIYSKPVIAVNPATVEMYFGAEYNLLDGVTVSDEYDEALKATVLDDNGFDGVKVGTYTITYTATNSKGQTATATRTVKVTANVVVEVPKNSVGTWNGTKMNFTLAQYHALNANYSAEYTTLGTKATSGVYHNVSNKQIVVSLTGSSGEAVILDANGMVIEGRDGANGQYVDKDNPTRVAKSGISESFAMNMNVPAGGMAVVVYPNTFGTSYDTDGCQFICENLVRYGAIARVFLDEANPVAYTTYANQAPTYSGNSDITVNPGEKTEEQVDALVLAGLAFRDDNGTFEMYDDITTGFSATIVDRGGFNVNAVGTYTYTLSVTDGEKTATFTRKVQVASNEVNITVGKNSTLFDTTLVAVNPTLTTYDNLNIVIYTKAYNSTPLENDFSVVTVFNRTTGKIVKIYDGITGKFFTEKNVQGGSGWRQGVVNKAWDSLGVDEVMIVGTTNGDKSGRTFLYGNRTIGAIVTITGVTF